VTRATIAIDNGTSGSVGIIAGPDSTFFATPTKDCLHYSKAGKMHQRIDVDEFTKALAPFTVMPCHAVIERPFTAGPMFVNTMLLAARAYEASLIVLEGLGIGYETVDSKGWQKAMLPGVTGSENLKKASRLKGCQLYPHLAAYINKHGDADGILMAHHYAQLSPDIS
jgi:hypothetical protein